MVGKLFSVSLFMAQIIPGPESAVRARARSADAARGAQSLWHLPGARAFTGGRAAATSRLGHWIGAGAGSPTGFAGRASHWRQCAQRTVAPPVAGVALASVHAFLRLARARLQPPGGRRLWREEGPRRESGLQGVHADALSLGLGFGLVLWGVHGHKPIPGPRPESGIGWEKRHFEAHTKVVRNSRHQLTNSLVYYYKY